MEGTPVRVPPQSPGLVCLLPGRGGGPGPQPIFTTLTLSCVAVGWQVLGALWGVPQEGVRQTDPFLSGEAPSPPASLPEGPPPPPRL